MLKAENIHKYYGQLHVLKGVDIEINPGEVVTLVGASGAGKSTLLQILGTLDFPDKGRVLYNQEDLSHYKANQQARFRNRELGFIFQFHHLLPEFNALENVTLPALISGYDKESAEKMARELLEYLQLGERAHHKPAELSGGEQQRVAVARALINRPKIILADEPTGNLDTQNSDLLYQLFKSLASEFGIGFLITTHNQSLARSADRCLRIRDGVNVPD